MDSDERGVSALWSSVNHVALVVSDVGRSVSFYADIVGMRQVMRPNFDRYIISCNSPKCSSTLNIVIGCTTLCPNQIRPKLQNVTLKFGCMMQTCYSAVQDDREWTKFPFCSKLAFFNTS